MDLDLRNIEPLVEALRRKDKQATMFAIRSDTKWNGPTSVQIAGRGTRVCDVRSALRVREAMCEPRQGDDLVLITNLDEQAFGLENLSQMALRRIEPMQPWAIIRSRMGLVSVDARLIQQSWIAERLLSAPLDGVVVPGGTLDYETAWSILLKNFGLTSARPTEDEIVLAASSPVFGQAFNLLPAEGKSDLLKLIQENVGRLGVTFLQVVQKGFSEDLVALGFVAECIFLSHADGAERIRGAFEERFGAKGIDGVLAARWGMVSRRLLATPTLGPISERIRQNADDILIKQLKGISYSDSSDQLPSGLVARVRTVAKLIEQALDGDVSGSLSGSLDNEVRRLNAHDLAARENRVGDRAGMAARLVRWLRLKRTTLTSLSDGMARYVNDEAWVDRARLAIHDGEAIGEAREAYKRLAERIAQERDPLNKFISTSVGNAVLPQGKVIGVEHVLERVLLPLVEDRPTALIVMDGMSQSVAIEMVESMQRARWNRYRLRTDSTMPMVVSVIPSVTEFSRTSLLCGRLVSGAQAQEKSGFAQFLQASNIGTSRSPKVFHKDAFETGSNEVDAAIASDAKVVAFVINAIDAQLAGSDQIRHDWSISKIPELERVVRGCELAGRAIILTSDHGHLVDESTKQFSATGVRDLLPAARWRGPDSEIREGELAVSGQRVLAEGGSCIVAANEQVRYGVRRAGYHGGVTPQEISCPLVVFIHESTDDKLTNWVAMESSIPSWWSIDGKANTVQPVLVSAKSGQPRTAKASLKNETDGLFGNAPQNWIEQLLVSEIYKYQCVQFGRATPSNELVIQMLNVFLNAAPLEANQSRLTDQAMAARLECSVGEASRKVNLLRRLLNIEGYPVLSKPDTETNMLDIKLLKTQFEIGGKQ